MSDTRDIAVGLALAGVRVAAIPVQAAQPLGRLATHLPLVGPPLRGVADSLALEGAGARVRLADEVERAIDGALAGQLTDAVARSLARHRVVERVASQVMRELDIERIVVAVLEDERTERLIVRVLESSLLDDLTERVLESPELQRVIEHVTSSPELLAAVTQHTETLAGEMVEDVRGRSRRVDDVAERTVRGWLRRPRPATT
jgi:hypothetical protein